jgi:hypothetical protein
MCCVVGAALAVMTVNTHTTGYPDAPHDPNYRGDNPDVKGGLSMAPYPRVWASFTAIETPTTSGLNPKYVAMFGGETANDTLTNELHLFNAERIVWEGGTRNLDGLHCNARNGTFCKPTGLEYDVKAMNEDVRVQARDYQDDEKSGLPPPRRRHAACSAGSLLYVFGGWGYDRRDGYAIGQFLNDLHIFDTATMRWSGELSSSRQRPSRREGHTLTRVGSKCYVFGGNGTGGLVNDLHYFPCPSTGASQTAVEWRRPRVRGSPPAKRYDFSTVAVGSKLYVFGGQMPLGNSMPPARFNDVHALDTKTMTWAAVATAGSAPATRSQHAAVRWGTAMLVFGGLEGGYNRQLDDVFALDTLTGRWAAVKDPVFAATDARRTNTRTARGGKAAAGYPSEGTANPSYSKLHTTVATNTALDERPNTRFAHSVAFQGDLCLVFGGYEYWYGEPSGVASHGFAQSSVHGKMMNAVDLFRLGAGVPPKTEAAAAAAGELYGAENPAASAAAKAAAAGAAAASATMEWLHRHEGDTKDAAAANYDTIQLSGAALPIFPYTEHTARVNEGLSQVHIPDIRTSLVGQF